MGARPVAITVATENVIWSLESIQGQAGTLTSGSGLELTAALITV